VLRDGRRDALGWGNAATIAISVALAFLFSYVLTFRSVVRRASRRAAPCRSRWPPDAVGADGGIVGNLFILLPGAMARASATACSGGPPAAWRSRSRRPCQ
jgi:hypothetical protein